MGTRLLFWLHHENVAFVLIGVVVVSFFLGRGLEWYVTNAARLYMDSATVNRQTEYVDAFFKKFGNPYFYFNYVVIVAAIFAVLSPKWAQYHFCNTLADLYTFSKILALAGIWFFVRANKLRKLTYTTRVDQEREYPADCGLVEYHYWGLGAVLIVFPALVFLFGSTVSCG